MTEFTTIDADASASSVLHKVDGTVLDRGIGRFVQPLRGQRLSYVRPGGVLVVTIEDGARVETWPIDHVPEFERASA